MDTENSGEILAAGPGQNRQSSADQQELLAQKLAEVLQENKILHDRLAELDISMNIETVEFKKDIESLSMERDELTKENEFLLEDYTAKEHKIQELLRQIEIKQLMINETSSYLGTATDRIRNLEKQCSGLEAQYAGIYGNRTASEKIEEGPLPEDEAKPRNALIEDIRKEFEETLGQKDLEIETLHRNMEQLQEQNKSLEAEQSETEKEREDTAKIPGPLENTLMEMEHSLLGLEQRISRASEIGVTEKEEILVKLDDAQREIFSLREYHRSLLEALRATDEEARKGVFSLSDYHQSILDALRTKEQEHEILKTETADLLATLREKEEAIGRLRDEIEQAGQGSSSHIQDFEEKLDHAEKRSVYLEAALAQESAVRADLEDTMQRKDMILQELHEHFVSDTQKLEAETAETRIAAERAADTIGQLKTIAFEREEKITDLSGQLAGLQALADAKSRETEALEEKYSRAEEQHQRNIKTSEEEKTEFQRILSLKERELEALARSKEALENELSRAADALAQQQDLAGSADESSLLLEEISRLKQENDILSAGLAATEKLETEAAAARMAAECAEEKISKLEALAADRSEKITGLNEQLARQQIFGEAKSREAAELAEEYSRAAEQHRRDMKTSEEEQAGLRHMLSLRDREIQDLARGQKALEDERNSVSAALPDQQKLEELEEKDSLQIEEISRLKQDNAALSSRLAEALQKTATLEEIRAAVSLEMKSLSEKMDSLKDEGMADRVTLKNNMDRSFSLIAESTERLEHVIAEGLPLAKKLEEISSGMMREALPAVYNAVPHISEKPGRSFWSRQLAAALGLLMLLVLTTAIFFRQEVYQAFSEKGIFAASPKPAAWETGTKQAKSGHYEATLTFLNKEAIQVLGFSDIIPEAGLAQNTFALIEIKSSGGCIPEDFISSPEKNMSFFDAHGTVTPLNEPGALSGWKKTIYKQNACGNKKAGAIYLKHIISAAKSPLLKGLTVRGLAESPLLIQ